MSISGTMRIVVAATVITWIAIVPCGAQESNSGNGLAVISGDTALSPTCKRAIRAGRNKFWLKNGTKMPVLLRKLSDDALAGKIVAFKKTYGKAVKRAKAIDASYADLKAPYLRHPHYFEDQLTHDLDAAALTGHVHIIMFLVRRGVNPDGVSTTEAEPSIMLAASCNRIDSMQKLFNLGANVNATVAPSARGDSGPINAVEEAVLLGNNKSVVWLLSHGANVCLQSTRKRILGILATPGISARIGSALRKRLQCRTEER